MKKTVIKDIAITVLILVCAFFLSVMFQKVFAVDEHISTLFAFAVFLISLLTNGYGYGIVSAFIGTLAINYVFTFPYFAFNFTIPVNIISAIVMVTIALLTGALTTQVKHQKEIKAESERERMRANLLRAVSHDIRTPLTTIYGSAETLLENRRHLTEAQKHKMLEGIKADADWLVRMVENLLSVTKIDSDRVKLMKTPMVLDELIDSVLLKFKKRYPNEHITIDIPDDIIVIPMDAILIEQVIINILENAIMHAQNFTKIAFRVYIEEKKAVFEIEDDGCGIPSEKLPKLFDGYYGAKEDPMPDSKKKNAGIGLSVCATIIRAHGGEITAENTENGALFRFVLAIEESNYGQ